MRGSGRLAIVMWVACGACSASAGAAVVTETFDFAFSNFRSSTSTPSPLDAASGRFTVTYDTSVLAVDRTTVAFSALSPGFLSVVPANYTYSPSLNGTLTVGGRPEGASTLRSNTDDFTLMIETVRTTPTFGLFTVSQRGYDGFADAFAGTVTRVTNVPEPATLGAIAGVAAFIVRRRRVA